MCTSTLVALPITAKLKVLLWALFTKIHLLTSNYLSMLWNVVPIEGYIPDQNVDKLFITREDSTLNKAWTFLKLNYTSL